jgi:DNA-binding IclR family transcriptional regulator
MAFSDPHNVSTWMATAHLVKCAPNTIVSADALQSELATIRRRGYAIEDEEFEIGVGGIAAPIVDGNRKVKGAISIVAPTSRLQPERLTSELIPLITWAGAELSAKCGLG